MIISNWISRVVVAFFAWFTPGTEAVTLWPFIFVWPSRWVNNKIMMDHERVHLKQWLRYLIVGFPFVYVYQFLKYGYKYMPLENEANGKRS